jgi:hypothetical protein
MAEFLTMGEGWWVTEMGDDQAYPVYVVRGPRPEGRGSRLCAVAGGGEALDLLLEARAVEAVGSESADRYLEKTVGIRRMHVVPFAVASVPADGRGKFGKFGVEVLVEQVDGKPLKVIGMRQVRVPAKGGRR